VVKGTFEAAKVHPICRMGLWQIYLATIDVAKRVFGILEVDPLIIELIPLEKRLCPGHIC